MVTIGDPGQHSASQVDSGKMGLESGKQSPDSRAPIPAIHDQDHRTVEQARNIGWQPRNPFPPVKHTTHEEVMARYREVLAHDKVGRLVDFQEFEHLKFPRRRFSDELLSELVATCSRNVSVAGPDVVIRHSYVGRRFLIWWKHR